MVKNFTPLNIDKFKNNHQVSYFGKEKELPIKKEVVLKEKIEGIEETTDEEIKPYVKIKPETIKIPPEIKKLGVKTKPTTSPFSSYQTVKLPIPDEKVVVGLRAPISSSFRWLATLAVYILKMAHLQLKIVGGRVVRVFRK